MNTSIPKTKFRPPLLHPVLLQRPVLFEWLKRDLKTTRLVLLSAPAGYGKTTLLTALPKFMPEIRLAWFSLDSDDNDPARFLLGLVNAFEVIEPGLLRFAEDQLSGVNNLLSGSDLNEISKQLINVLLNRMVDDPPPPFMLVLDDFHLIENEDILTLVNYLIDHLPEQVQLGMTSRSTPALALHKLRARRQILEFGPTHLRFSPEEINQFLQEQIGVKPDQAELSRIVQKTEGWPAGLALLTSRLYMLQNKEERALFYKQLNQINQFTFPYLADEVLSTLPESLRTFLYRTAILKELTPDVCTALTDLSEAEDILQSLHKRNLFINLIGKNEEEQPVYRYHALFAEFLQYEFKKRNPQQFLAAHLKAAAITEDPEQIIYHYLSAESWKEAANVIENVGERLIERGLQGTLLNWIQRLPTEIINVKPHLLYLQGFCAMLKGDNHIAQPVLEKAITMPETDQRFKNQIVIGLAALFFIQADFTRCAELLSQTEPAICGDQDKLIFWMLRSSLALFCDSDWAQAEADLDQALNLVQSSEQGRLWFLLAIFLGTEFTVLPGALDKMEQFCRLACQKFGEQYPPLYLGILDTWTSIHLRRGNLEEAIRMGTEVQRIKRQLGGYPFLGVNAAYSVAAAYLAQEEWDKARGYLDLMQTQIKSADLNRLQSGEGLYPKGKYYWLRGEYEAANQVYRQLVTLENRLPFLDVSEAMLGGLLSMADQHFREAESFLKTAVRLQAREWISEVYGSARLLLAYLYYRWEKPQEALSQLDAVLAQAESRNLPGLILSDMFFAAPLLRLAVVKKIRTKQATGYLFAMNLPLEDENKDQGPLTERQLEILELVAAGYSNQAIADKLVISLATVKSHVVNIMNRLGVSSRMEAVAAAREAGFLS